MIASTSLRARQSCKRVYECESAEHAIELALEHAKMNDCILICGSLYLIGECEKILRGLVKACEKRPVSMDRLDRAVEEIISELHRDHLREVPSSEIGKKVIEKLYAIDPVAYIRYVSVYRQFSNVEEFIQEITQMRHQTLIDPLQRKLPIL